MVWLVRAIISCVRLMKIVLYVHVALSKSVSPVRLRAEIRATRKQTTVTTVRQRRILVVHDTQTAPLPSHTKSLCPYTCTDVYAVGPEALE